MEKILNLLCDPKDPRVHVQTPWHVNGYSYSTDGSCLLRVEGEFGKPESSGKHPKVDDYFNFDAMNGDGVPLDIEHFNKQKKKCKKCDACHEGVSTFQVCDFCEGEGFLVCNLDHVHDCDNCCGSGYFGKHTAKDCPDCRGTGIDFGYSNKWKFGERHYAMMYLDLLQINLPGLLFYPDIEVCEGAMGFKFEGGDGVLMSVKGER